MFLSVVISLHFSYVEIPNVPFIKQEPQFCGPAALSSVFAYYGVLLEQKDIAKEIYHPGLKGALITDMKRYSEKIGFKAVFDTGTIETIKKYIDEKKPVIVLVELGFWVFSKPHYMVVYGYDEDNFYVHTGDKSHEKINFSNFIKMWQHMGNSYLVIYR